MAAFCRLISIGAMFGSVAIAARRLESESFGLWALLLTVPFMAGLASMGINAGAGNRLAAMTVDDARASEARRFFCSTFYAQLITCVLVSLVALVVIPFVDWGQVFKISEAGLARQVKNLLATTVVFSLLAVPFSNSYGGALAAFHRVQLIAALMAVQNIILFVFVACTVGRLKFESLVLGYFLLNWVLVALFFVLTLGWIGWRLEKVGMRETVANLRPILKPCAEFWVLNVSATLITAGQTSLVALAGGVAVAGPYSVLQRLFSLLVTLHLAFFSPWIPVYTQRAVREDWQWLAEKNRKLSFVTTPLMLLGVGIPMVIVHPWILELWTKIPYQNYPLATLLLVGSVLGAMGSSLSILLNSLGHFRSQAVLGVITALVFAGGFSLLHERWGVASIPISTILSLAIGVVILQRLVSSVCREKRISV